ncbi:AraC family transcriptional regulator [Caldimonas brevitalea]|uniref:Transcriptional regulator, AraC family n=1 Tax=Caldimonas brevitalea TaxID=413882 RepID=A0A0G3BQG6_9BURK|nr:AraC family transcriptional regulator [Caldimonas brevitalea]AKJ30233.1 transcriptional regulator, AraC family [Caldimonas brevitalea]
MAYLNALCEAMELPGDELPGILEEVGISPGFASQPTARVTEQQVARLYRLLATRLDDEMPRLFSRPLRPGALKFTCLSLLDARSLLVALHRWSHVLRLLQDDFQLDVWQGQGTSVVALVEPAQRASRCKPVALDLMLKLIHGVASWLIGKRIPLKRVDFSFAKPAFAAEYQALYPGPVLFEQHQTAFHIDSSYLHLPVRRSRQELNEFLRRAPEDWLFASFQEERLGQRLREHLAWRLPLPVTAESAAEALHVSTRSLHRHLRDEGTSFQRVKDELRRDIAVQKLTRTREPMAAIAAELGFDSTASFHRAFKGWTGDTPGAYRAGGGEGARVVRRVPPATYQPEM